MSSVQFLLPHGPTRQPDPGPTRPYCPSDLEETTSWDSEVGGGSDWYPQLSPALATQPPARPGPQQAGLLVTHQTLT